MKNDRLQFSLLLAAIAAVGVSGPGHAASPPSPPREYYSITDLGTLGGNASTARAINSSGQVVGESLTATGNKHAFRTAPNRPINPATDDLGTLGGTTSLAWGINDLGQVVGYAYTAAGVQHGFRTAANSPINPATDDLGTLGGPVCVAYAINKYGQVAGYSDSDYWGGSWDLHAFRTAPYSPINPATDDLKMAGVSWSYHQAFNINNAGQVVGQVNAGSPLTQHAFRTIPGNPINLATDDLNVFWSGASVAWGINSVGQVVGMAYPSPTDKTKGEAFRTAANSPIYSSLDLLGTLGGANSTAISINTAGQVVGFADTLSKGRHAFLWEDATRMMDLNDLIPSCSGWVLARATCINEAGQIVGGGFLNGNINERAFLLTPAPVKLIGLEVTQVVQDWRNSVPLVAGKETWVRAHIQAMGTSSRGLVTARLHGTDLSKHDLSPALRDPVVPGFILPKADATNSSVRAEWSDTLNFQLPPQWCAGTIVLTLETTDGLPFQVCGEPAEPNGTPCDGQVTVSFRPAATPRITFVPLRYFNPITKVVHEVSPGNIDELVNRLRAIYPLARSWGLGNGATASPLFPWTEAVPMIDPVPTNGPEIDTGKFVALICEKLNLFNAYSSSSNSELYYGVFKGPPWGGGTIDVGGLVGAGSMSDNAWVYTRNQHAHELGHLLGRYHASDAIRRSCDPDSPDCQLGPCGGAVPIVGGSWPVFPYYFNNNAVIGPMDQGDDHMIFGLDTSTSPPTIVDPHAHFELMSYCGADAGISQWISPFTYTNLWSAMPVGLTAPLTPTPRGPLGLAQPYLLIRGIINLATDATTLLPFGGVTTAVPPSSQPTGDYLLQLLDGTGRIVRQVAFRPHAGSGEGGGQSSFTSFLIPVLADPAIKQAVVIHNANLLAFRAASSHPPQVSILSPTGGENFAGGMVTLQWTASDLDGDALTCTVLYSTDASATWQTLAVDLTNRQFQVSTDFLKETTQGRFQVMASDGFITAAAESSGLFTVAGHAPKVTISQPAEGQLFSGSQLVVLAADARDLEDGYLSGPNLKWSSSIQGNLGEGEDLTLAASALAEGSHLMTVVATDSGGLTATAAVHVVVSRIDPASAPALRIAAVNGQPHQKQLSYQPLAINRTYTPQFSSNLLGPVWSTLSTVIGPQTNGNQVTLTDTNAIEPRKFYRLLISPP